MNKKLIIIFLFLFPFLLSNKVSADRIKDLVSFAGIRSNQLVGYGLVIGLAKTGDGSVNLTKQSIAAMISQFGVIASTADIDGSNSATVMVTSNLPAFAKPGQTIDVTVSTIGKAKSLKGGTLLMTALKGADGKVYAIAQGNLVVGGLGIEGADGSSTIQGTPTVGRIPGGATVEKLVENTFLEKKSIVLNLHQSDFSQANKVAESINKTFGPDVAVPLDATSIKVRTPSDPSQKVSFIGLLENISFEPVRPKAKVVVNSRTGTVVIGGDVRITPAAVAHGSLSVKIKEDTKVLSEGTGTVVGTSATVAGTAATTAADTEIEVDQEPARAFVFDPGIELQTLVDALNETGTTATDMVAILEALREAGALRAELIII
ncbi:MAG: flagellar biosynthesis protein FlgI [Rickettsiales bacterium]|nr:flagellar biosynthesis protein FlgI [Rickettsiales bacterium]|tara:strand:- start:160 stop:1287 length:1128 start_codon:yes stop_codon:yes gene_type:complete